jgi:hypothetical protein
VYGKPLRIPGELLTPTADPVDPAHLIAELRQRMARLRPVPAARHASRLYSCTATSRSALSSSSGRTQNAELWNPLQRPLPGPVTEREDAATPRAREARHCQLTGSSLPMPSTGPAAELQLASRSKPGRSTTCQATTAPNYTLRSPHSFSRSLQYLSNHLRGGGGYVGTSDSQTTELPQCSVRVTLRPHDQIFILDWKFSPVHMGPHL